MHRCNLFTYPWDIANVGAADTCSSSRLTLHPHPCYCSVSNCLPSRPLLLTHEVSIRAVQEFWELEVWLSSVPTWIKTLASVVLFLGDNLSVRVKQDYTIAIPICPKVLPRLSTTETLHPALAWDTSVKQQIRCCRRTRWRIPTGILAFSKELWCPNTGEVFLLASKLKYIFIQMPFSQRLQSWQVEEFVSMGLELWWKKYFHSKEPQLK